MGKVYILTNDSMPGIIKIGITEMETIEERIKSLDNTSVPTPFRFYFAIETDKHKEIEKLIHNAFSEYRIRNNREFFEMAPERAVAALKISGAPEIKLDNEMIDEEGTVIEEDQSKKYRKRFSFSYVNIPIGAELTYTRDDNIKCIVASDNEVEYNNKKYSLSKLADKLLTENGYNWKSVQGPLYFKYNEKTLFEMKKEIENKLMNDDNEE
jgi:T5orf172 domain.